MYTLIHISSLFLYVLFISDVMFGTTGAHRYNSVCACVIRQDSLLLDISLVGFS